MTDEVQAAQTAEQATALNKAKTVCKAIEVKLEKLGSKHKAYPRLIINSAFTYVELAFSLPNMSPQDEIKVAYAADYFSGMTDNTILKERATRILKDVQLSLGMDPNAG